jgi:hypothetical protein
MPAAKSRRERLRLGSGLGATPHNEPALAPSSLSCIKLFFISALRFSNLIFAFLCPSFRATLSVRGIP